MSSFDCPFFHQLMFQQLKQVWLFPFMYAFSMLAVCLLMTLGYQTQKRLLPSSAKDLTDSSC